MAPKLEDYDVLEFIGCGRFGNCYKIKQKSDSKILVWKVLDFSQMTEDEKKLMVGEVNLLRKLNHPYILRYVGKILDKPNSLLYIITDYCEGGDLAKFIAKNRKTRKSLLENFIWKIFCQLTLALDFCHDRSKNGIKILHRDIKPSNVYLDINKNAILGDFGVARCLSEKSVYAKTYVGTNFYMSPEILANKPYNDKTDVWSLGCLIHELCCLLPPFIPQRNENVYKKIITSERIPISESYSELLRSSIDKMLIVDFKKRPSIKELLNLPSLAMIYKNFQPDKNELQPEVKKERCRSRSRTPQPGKREALAEKEKNIQLRENQLDDRERELQKRECSLNLQSKLMKEKSERDNEYARLCEQLGLHSLKRPLTKECSEQLRISMCKTLTRSQPIPQEHAKRFNFYSSDDANQFQSTKIYPANQFVRCTDQTKKENLKATKTNEYNRDDIRTLNYRLQKAQQRALRLRIAEINSKMKTSPF